MTSRISTTVVAAAAVFLTGCGVRASVTPEATVPVTDPAAAPENSVQDRVHVDAAGNSYVLASVILGPGERISVDEFLRQVADGPIVVGGLTFGNPQVTDDYEKSVAASPDFLAVLDPSGSPTIIGFLPARTVLEMNGSTSGPVYGSDGVTVVGTLRQVRTATTINGIPGDSITQVFVQGVAS